MRKSAIVLGLILLLAIGANAQDEETGLTGMGVKVGLNMSNMYGDDVEGTDMKLDFGVGAFLTYNFMAQFAVQPEVLYMRKGSKEEAFGVTAKWSIDYIEIPVLLKYGFPMEGKIKPSLFAGPAVAFIMSSKFKVENEEIDAKDGMKSMDIGIVFGGGLSYQLTSVALTLDVRYTLGMTKFVDHEEFNKLEGTEHIEVIQYPEDPDVKHNNISIMAGVSF